MKTLTPRLLAVVCSLALAGAASAAIEDPDDDPAQDHHTGGDAARHSETLHPADGQDPDAEVLTERRPRVEIECPKVTGDADIDFAMHMRRHHLHAVELAEAEIAAGDDAQMRAAAQAIVTGNTAEVARLDSWLAANGVARDVVLADCGHHHGHGMHGHAMHKFADLDTDGDGFIEHNELTDTHPMHQHFAMIDTNADGMLTAAEVDAHHHAMADGKVAGRLTAAPHPTHAEAFAALDANRDGFLVASEMATTEMLYQHFAAADTNKDGRLTQAEVDAHHAVMHAQMKH